MGNEGEEWPEVGELVLATVSDITPYGAYVRLDEYGGLSGFLHVSEVSTGWVRNIERFVRPKQKVVLKVIRVNKSRREVDLSLRQVTGDERREKMIEVKKADRARAILEVVRSRLGLEQSKDREYRSLILNEFDTLYDALEEVVRSGEKALEGLPLPKDYVATLVEVAREKIALPQVEVKGVLELTCDGPDGIEAIKEALLAAQETKYDEAQIRITYLGAPRYHIGAIAGDYRTANKALDMALQRVRERIGRRGRITFQKEQAK